MFQSAARTLRAGGWLTAVGFVGSILTLVIVRINAHLLDDSLTAARQGQLDAARVILSISDALQILGTVVAILSAVPTLAGLGYLIRSQVLVRNARRGASSPADTVSGTVQVFGDLIDLLRQVHDDLASRATAVQTAEQQLAQAQTLQTMTPEQTQAVRSQVTENLIPQFAKSTKLTIVGLALAVLLLVVSHYWK